MAKAKLAPRRGKAPGRAPRRESKEWAFLAYIAGDNNLSDFAMRDVQEMCDEGSAANVYVGVEIDTQGGHTGSIRYEISEPDWEGKSHRVIIERLSERDSGSPEVLEDFLRWGFGRFPAQNSVVVVGGHGKGFRGRRRIASDDFGSSLDMPEIRGALRAAGITASNKVAVLGFDACLMNLLEIAHHFRTQVEILVGSQQTEPGDGWPYHEVLKKTKSSKNPEALGKKIVEVYIAHYGKRNITNVTQSAINLARVDAAMIAISQLGTRLARSLRSEKHVLEACRIRTQRFVEADYIDLMDFAGRVAEEYSDRLIQGAAHQVLETTKACIIHSHVLGKSVRNAKGLSIWFPPTKDAFLRYRGKYLSLDFASTKERSGWLHFLDEYYLQP